MNAQIDRYHRLLRLKQHHIRVLKPLVGAETVVCKHCGQEYVGRYCPNCGQKSKVTRLTLSGIVSDAIELLTNFDHSFTRTMVELFYRPGYMIRDYLLGHRVCYFKPVQLLAFLTTVYLAVSYLLGSNTDNAEVMGEISGRVGKYDNWIGFSLLQTICNFMKDNELLSNLSSVFIIAIAARYCFRRTPFGRHMNIVEHIYAQIYINSQSIFLEILALPVTRFVWSGFDDLSDALLILLIVWDYAQLMGIRFRRSLKLFSATAVLIVLVIGIAVFLFLGVFFFDVKDR